MEPLYAFVLIVANVFGCFSLPKWTVEVTLGGCADLTVPDAFGESCRYPDARLWVYYDKKGRAIKALRIK